MVYMFYGQMMIKKRRQWFEIYKIKREDRLCVVDWRQIAEGVSMIGNKYLDYTVKRRIKVIKAVSFDFWKRFRFYLYITYKLLDSN